MTTTALHHQTDALAQAYGQAWNDHDLDAIMDMHADGMCFHLHLEGFAEARTPADVREQFGLFFTAFPDIHFAPRRLVVTDDLFVHEFTLSGTLAIPFPIGSEIAQPGTGSVSFDGVDVIPCRDGKVLRKDTYLDGVAMRSALGVA